MAQSLESTEESVDRVLERSRDLFLEHYGISIRNHRKYASPGQSIHLELCVRRAEADPDDVYENYRLDLVVYDPEGKNRFIDVEYDRLIHFAPFDFTRGGLTVHLHPFQWRAVNFAIQGEPGALDSLRAWTRKWLLDQGPEQSKPFELANVIHSVAPVEPQEPGQASFWVDFGTAPKEAFWELLDVLEASGVTELSVQGDREAA